jgi:hypothetical protein
MRKMFGTLLRGGLCATWLVAFVLGALKFLAFTVSDAGSADADIYGRHFAICIIVGIVAAAAHAYLINEEMKNV